MVLVGTLEGFDFGSIEFRTFSPPKSAVRWQLDISMDFQQTLKQTRFFRSFVRSF